MPLLGQDCRQVPSRSGLQAQLPPPFAPLRGVWLGWCARLAGGWVQARWW